MTYFIWKLPAIQGGITFDDTMVRFLLDIAGMVLGLYLCFGGRRALGSCTVTALGLACGWGGVLISRHFPANDWMKLVFFTMFCFLGLCMAYFLDTLWKAAAKKLPGYGQFGDRFGWLPAFLGAGLTAGTLWQKVYRVDIAAWALFALLSLLGILRQRKDRMHPRITHTYDDLYKMEGREGA